MRDRFTASALRVALPALLACLPFAAQAAPITGSGQPIDTVQPSVGINYIVRTSDPANPANLGQIALFAGGVVPGGWTLASGQTLPINQFPTLFNAIGTRYGGDGVTTFALPNLQGRTAIGAGNGGGLAPQPLGNTSGSFTQTLTVNQLPPFGGAGGSFGSQPVSVRQPSEAVNYGVVVQGNFPLTGNGPAQNQLLGQIVTYSGTVPQGVLPADGRTLAINQNQALFSILGINFGGNGTTTFNLPDLQGRAPTGVGSVPGLSAEALGTRSGAEQVTLDTANLPPNHITLGNGHVVTIGSGVPFSVMQPSLGLEPIIAVNANFPLSGTDTGDQPFLGEISWFAGNTAPSGWLFADGQMLQIVQFPALFDVLGTSFGGNGIATFGLPNLMDRIAVGPGNGFRLGDVFGTDLDTLLYSQFPIGYPANPPLTTAVPEPPAVGFLIAGLAAMVLLRSGARPHPRGSLPRPSLQS